jgi:alkaline phosphatase
MNGTGSRSLATIAEIAHDAGMRVGIISSVNVDHATPACYYAHNVSRNNYYDIGVELANTDFEYVAGGRVRIDKTPDGSPSVLDIMEDNGWMVAGTRSEFLRLPGTTGQVFTYNYGFAADALDYDMDRESNDISLAEFTEMGIDLLNNPNGFFMMIEGGKIDWACHANDAVAAIGDTLAFDEAIRVAINFYEEHPTETLIIVTGDHECGGLTLGFAGTAYGSAFNVLDAQVQSFEYFDQYVLGPYKQSHTLADADTDELLPVIEEYFGLTDLTDYELELIEEAFVMSMGGVIERSSDDETYLLYGGYEPLTITLTHIVNRRAGLAWTSYAHTGVPVPTFAIGPGSGLFNGYYDNTDVFHRTLQAMGLRTTIASR